jgi:hypothetical protein
MVSRRVRSRHPTLTRPRPVRPAIRRWRRGQAARRQRVIARAPPDRLGQPDCSPAPCCWGLRPGQRYVNQVAGGDCSAYLPAPTLQSMPGPARAFSPQPSASAAMPSASATTASAAMSLHSPAFARPFGQTLPQHAMLRPLGGHNHTPGGRAAQRFQQHFQQAALANPGSVKAGRAELGFKPGDLVMRSMSMRRPTSRPATCNCNSSPVAPRPAAQARPSRNLVQLGRKRRILQPIRDPACVDERRPAGPLQSPVRIGQLA